MKYTLYQVADNAEAQLDSNIGASTLSIILKSGQGALFPQPYSGTTTSLGTSTTLNKTGIGASGISAGDFIENTTDSSYAFVVSVSTDSLTTTALQGGSDNTWQNGDGYQVNSMIGTLNKRDLTGRITSYEKVKIIGRSSDSLTVDPAGRGFDGSVAKSFNADDYFNLFVAAKTTQEMRKAFADVCQQLDLKASILYVQASLAARSWKDPVVVATTTSGTLSTDYQNGSVVDGVTLATGDRILVKNQVTQSQNGIYVVAASGTPTRASDFDSASEVTGAAIGIIKGSSNGDTVWICTSDSPNVGTDALVFAQVGASISKASQAEAEAAVNDTKFMTPLQTYNAMVKNNAAINSADYVAIGGTGADGDLTVTGTTTLDIGTVYNFNNVNVQVGGTLSFVGTPSSNGVAVLNIKGNFTMAGTINTQGMGAIYDGGIMTRHGFCRSGKCYSFTDSVGGAGGAGTSAGGTGGTSTASTGTQGAGGTGAGGNGGGGYGNVGGGGGASGSSTGAAAVNGSASSGNNGGAGGTSAQSNGTGYSGGGGGGGGGLLTGNGGAGGGVGNAQGGLAGQGGAGGASGASGGNGGAGGKSGDLYSNGTGVSGAGGAGGNGYVNGGTGGAGSNNYNNSGTGAVSAGGAGGIGRTGTGGTGGAGGGWKSSGGGGTAAAGGVGGNGFNGGQGGQGGSNATATGAGGVGGKGGDGGGSAGLYILVGGNVSITGTFTMNGGNGGAGGAGGTGVSAIGGAGGNGGNGGNGGDLFIGYVGTLTHTATINLKGGTAGSGGSGGSGSSSGSAGTAGTAGRDGLALICKITTY